MVSVKTLNHMVETAIEYMKHDKIVEFGCFGGHGRTGTVLAALIGKVEGMTVQKAVDAVRDRYCIEAIESQEQVDALLFYLGGDGTALPDPDAWWKEALAASGYTPKDIAGIHHWKWSKELQAFVPDEIGGTNETAAK